MIRASQVFLRTALTLSCSFLFIASFSQNKQVKEKTQTLLRIDKKAITAEEFIYLYKKNHQDTVRDYTSEKINEYLDLFINFKLKVKEARNRGLDTTRAFIKEYEGYRDELRKPYLPDAEVIDSLVALTYQRMQEEINASHILISLKPDASPMDTLKAYNKVSDIRNRLLSGADFGELARESSDDPSAKSNNGNLGYFTALQMVYPFESAAYATAKGSFSPPVRTRFGYHILKVNDRRPALGEVEVSHIMLRNDGEQGEVKNLIFNIHDQLQAGVEWNELCKQYSQDATTKDNGGKLRPFKSGAMAAVPEFENIAFRLQKPGEISDPFQTQYGWHIIRLEKKIPVPPFNVIEASLKSKVARDERTEISRQDLHRKLRQKYSYVEMPAAKAKVITTDSTYKKGKWNPALTASELKGTLFTLANHPVAVAEFVNFVNSGHPSATTVGTPSLEQYYHQFVDKSVIDLVEKEIEEKHPEYRFLLQEYYEGILLFDIMEKEVWGKASQDSAGQRAYYKEHIVDYETEERAQATLYSTSTSQLLEPLKQLIKDSSLAKVDEFVLKNKLKVESGYFPKGKKSVLAYVPWSEGLHSAENEGIYYLAWLKRILPAGPMSFEEARPSVISDYQSMLEKNWVTTLKRKYRVKINEKAKRQVLQELQTRTR